MQHRGLLLSRIARTVGYPTLLSTKEIKIPQEFSQDLLLYLNQQDKNKQLVSEFCSTFSY